MDDVYTSIAGYSLTKKRDLSEAFDDMISDMNSIEKLQILVIELFIRVRYLFTEYFFGVYKSISVHKSYFQIRSM